MPQSDDAEVVCSYCLIFRRLLSSGLNSFWSFLRVRARRNPLRRAPLFSCAGDKTGLILPPDSGRSAASSVS